MTDPLIETWAIHARINVYLLKATRPADLLAAPSSKGRTVGESFAHIHNVRLMWLNSAAPDLLHGLEKVEKDSDPTPSSLTKALEASGTAIGELIGRSLGSGGKVKGFKPHVQAFVGYLISHESHHRGQIALALKQSGAPLDKKVSFGMWEWGTR